MILYKLMSYKSQFKNEEYLFNLTKENNFFKKVVVLK